MAISITASVGTATVGVIDVFAGMQVITIAGTSGAGSLTAVLSGVRGIVRRITIAPTLTGGVTPTTLFDMTLTDPLGADILKGKGADLIVTGPTDIATFVGDGTFAAPIATYGDLTLAVTNAGTSKQFQIRLFVSTEF